MTLLLLGGEWIEAVRREGRCVAKMGGSFLGVATASWIEEGVGEWARQAEARETRWESKSKVKGPSSPEG
jgi:hypothetical protein